MLRRTFVFTVWLGFALALCSSAALAQYQITNLDSNQVGKASHDDPLIVNAWGLVHGPGTAWWLSDNSSGWSTLYDGTGKPITGLRVVVPTAGNGPDSGKGLNGPGSPTGIVYNATSAQNGAQEFQVQGWSSIFLFATLDGTISGWSPISNFNQAILAVDNSANKSVYTGLAITNRPKGNLLYAADLANGKVDMFDANFKLVKSFTDAMLLSGFAPFGIRDINGIVYVAYASVSGGNGGFVVQFREDGTPVSPGKPLISGLPLNQPWGIAGAPRNFGPLSNTLLISNNTNFGTINAFDPFTGQLVGSVKDSTGNAIRIDQLWGIDFGDGLGNNGAATQLFFAAGPNNNLAGTFGVIKFEP
ncbi:MAG TPA: TIGR03118 family protein [Candidatus Sulfotelmatobacter sp.]|nr:TIGR03118 family protein [Candidatus Sulfotelmatobacter sp.]